MSLECRIEVRAASAEGIAALSRLHQSGIAPISESAITEIHRYRLEPGIHETIGSLLLAIKWSDLAYGAAGSLIATGIVALAKSILQPGIPKSASVKGLNGPGVTTARIEIADQQSILGIELTGIEAETAAGLIREIVDHADP
jgi:hypothetical protein